MSVCKVEKSKNFTIISNTIMKDKNLSLKAKGLLCVVMSLPDDWDYSINGLVAICKENMTAIKSTLAELTQYGYLVRKQLLPNETESKRYEYVYTFYEKPQPKKEETKNVENQCIGNLSVDNQSVDNPIQLSTNKQSTKNKIPSKDGTQKSAEFSFGKSSNTDKPKSNNEKEYLDSCLLIDNYTDDNKLRKVLKELFRNKQIEAGKNRHRYSATTCKKYLEFLSEVPDDLKVESVNLSIQYENCTTKAMIPHKNGYRENQMQNYRLGPQKKATDADKARDENGNYITF